MNIRFTKISRLLLVLNLMFVFEMNGQSVSKSTFLNPPQHYQPWVFWQWMNGNITKEGIRLDLEAMRRMGITGALCFNNALGIPRGPVDYASAEWMEDTEYAVKEAKRLGITIMLHNSPGYSGAGGPWIKPEMSMQQLVWTETLAKNKKKIDVVLNRPYAKRGFYKDARVIAYPSLSVEKILMKDAIQKLSMDGKTLDIKCLTDGNPETKIRIEPKQDESKELILEFKEPFEARSISILRRPEVPKDLFDGPRDHPPLFELKISDDGVTYKTVCSFAMNLLREMDTPGVANFEAVKARFFKLVTKDPTWISDIELHSAPRLAGWPGKINCTGGNSSGLTPQMNADLTIHHSDIIDITSFMDANGHLVWTAPQKSNWTILRIGHTTTGEENAAHPESGKGLELDKLNPAALDVHFDQFLNKVAERLKPYGETFQGFTVDSWEAGKQSWTARFPEEFLRLKKYDITAWLPALTGRIIDDIESTDRFLWDVRQVHADLLNENFYARFQEKCHQL